MCFMEEGDCPGLGGGFYGVHMRLAVVIVNYRTPQLCVECLASIAAERAGIPHLQVLLLDNASPDDSVAVIAGAVALRGWQDWVRILPQKQNLGFAAGNNVGIRKALESDNPPEFLLLLNSDTRVHAGCLRKSMERMGRDRHIGALSCMVRNADGSVQNVCRKFATPLRESCRAVGLPYLLPRLFGWANLEDTGWDRRSTAREVEWIGGAFMLLRAAVIQGLGGLDESFFFYGEDIELCHRIRRAGWSVFFDPAGEITHLGGGSSDGSRLADLRRLEFVWKARFHVQRKCYGVLSALWIRTLYLGSVALNLASIAARGGRGSQAWVRTAKNLRVLAGTLKQ